MKTSYEYQIDSRTKKEFAKSCIAKNENDLGDLDFALRSHGYAKLVHTYLSYENNSKFRSIAFLRIATENISVCFFIAFLSKL